MIATLETERLVLRPFVPEDRRAVHAYAADPAVMTYIPGGALSKHQVKAFVAEGGGDEATAAAVLKAEGRLIGHLPFHPWFHPRIWAIGRVFHPGYRGWG